MNDKFTYVKHLLFGFIIVGFVMPITQTMLPEGWHLPGDECSAGVFAESHSAKIIGNTGTVLYQAKNQGRLTKSDTTYLFCASANLESFEHYNGPHMVHLDSCFRLKDAVRVNSFKKFFEATKADIYAFQECDDQWLLYMYELGLLQSYSMVRSPNSQLLLIFNPDIFELYDARIEDGCRMQAVLLVYKHTGEKLVIVNSHARFNAMHLHCQIYVDILNQVALFPTIVCGDWNTDLGANTELFDQGNSNFHYVHHFFEQRLEWKEITLNACYTSRSVLAQDLFETVIRIFVQNISVSGQLKMFPESPWHLLVLNNDQYKCPSNDKAHRKMLAQKCHMESNNHLFASTASQLSPFFAYDTFTEANRDKLHFSDHTAFCFRFFLSSQQIRETTPIVPPVQEQKTMTTPGVRPRSTSPSGMGGEEEEPQRLESASPWRDCVNRLRQNKSPLPAGLTPQVKVPIPPSSKQPSHRSHRRL